MEIDVSPKKPVFGHIALDLFSDTDVCVTVDLRYGPLKGVLSLLFHWEYLKPILVDYSSWFVRTEVAGDISENTTWTPAGNPYYVTDSVWINDGVTLTIQPGTVVRFRKFTNPQEQVIRVENGSTAIITNHCSLTGNYGVYCINSEPQIHFNNIAGNEEYSVYNETPFDSTVYAEENWWGAADGPSGAGAGTGDRVSFGVVFEPWLIEPVCE